METATGVSPTRTIRPPDAGSGSIVTSRPYQLSSRRPAAGAPHERFFAYADILGFTPLVKQSESDIGAFNTIRALLSQMERRVAIWSQCDLARLLPEDSIPKPVRDLLLQMADENRQFAFSDTILFSGANDADGLWNILTNLGILTLDLLKAGWLLR
jgi:hypothetical protein